MACDCVIAAFALMRSLWNASLIGASQPPEIPLEPKWGSNASRNSHGALWDEGAIGWDGRYKPPIVRKRHWYPNVKARSNAHWRARGSDSERIDFESTSRESEDYGVSKWTPLLGALEPGEAAGYDQPSSDHVVHLANACEAHNENRYEVVIICNVHNVNAYRRRVAGLLKKYGGATQRCSEGAVKDDNHKKKKNLKRRSDGGNRPLRVCCCCRTKLFVKMKVGTSSTVQDVQSESAGVLKKEQKDVQSESAGVLKKDHEVSLSESEAEL